MALFAETMNYLLLTSLIVCHFFADFCLTTSSMIRAKADGKVLLPILEHSFVHALLMGFCLLLFETAWKILIMLMVFEMLSHFLIDTGKGLIMSHFKIFADNRRKPYWILYGFDQLLHQTIIILIWMFAQ
ncbi:DUF3307 domain-containing protein [Pseudoprevotella muciniphila]|uniref:DUF3307 domain-containing protein n=1 Tax=Pseudoprevotella muciniphila TaxID=2133944 RepID=A0A5P8E3S0_9BACT|nr:DUF3307 domain-containing protein [Pseudoprevotella muciniphila]QFQ11665.1 DUF3307 domain-containing protein [Pseudoprevotella muciniphila]